MEQSNILTSILGYQKLINGLAKLSPTKAASVARNLCRTDLYFLIRYGLGRKDIEHPWLLDRCREIQANPNGHLDLWAREHYKSTIITYGKTIQDILSSHGENPIPDWGGVEPTFGIFSHTRPIAKGFLRQIKRELESNRKLIEWFPDVLWDNPHKQAPKWSEDDGLVVRRKSNPKESTVEAWGLVDGQPTGKHFFVRIYDDVVTVDSVWSANSIQRTTEAWEISINLGVDGGYERYIGTRYHYNDTYRAMKDRQVVKVREYPGTVDGTVDGGPVLQSKEYLADKRRSMGPYTFACQILMNPKADETQGFKREWLKYYRDAKTGKGMNIYILIDPASEKKKGSDYTAVGVIGLSEDKNYYLLDLYRDRLNLTQRASLVMTLHRKWKPVSVGYEKYGMQADIEHIKSVQEEQNYRFNIIQLGGNMPKNDRIRRLIPVFEQGKFYLPTSLHKTNYEGIVVDVVDELVNQEYLSFPVGGHDDMIDMMARILDEDLNASWPNSDWGKEIKYPNVGIV